MLDAVVVGALAFGATNLDDFLLLIGFMADPGYRVWTVTLGQFLGIAVLVGASLACALAALTIPKPYIGLLGLAPLTVGVSRLWRLVRERDPEPEQPSPAGPLRGGIGSVMAITIANGGDNLSAYIPLFATTAPAGRWIMICIFALLTGVWCGAAYVIARRIRTRKGLQAWGRRALPFVLIALGGYILWRAGSVSLLG